MNPKILFLALSVILLSIGILAIARCDPGISVTVIEIDSLITSPSDTATYIVNVESITTEAENVRLTVSDGPDLSFNWTLKEFELAVGATESFGLEATYLGLTPGDFAFTVLGEAWPLGFTYDELVEEDLTFLIEESSFTDYVHVTPTGVIPEVPLGTAIASASMILALVAYTTVPRFRRRQLHTI